MFVDSIANLNSTSSMETKPKVAVKNWRTDVRYHCEC